MHRRPTILPFIALALFLGPRSTFAQELTAYHIKASSEHPEIGSGRGFGGAFSAAITPWLLARIDVDTRDGSNQRLGLTCLNSSGVFGCTETENISSTTRLDAFTLGLMPYWEPRAWIRIAGGGGLAIAQVRHEVSVESGRSPAVSNPRSAHVGFGLTAELRVHPLAMIPIAFSAALHSRTLFLDGCVDNETLHQPFCGRERFDDARVGVSILIGGKGRN